MSERVQHEDHGTRGLFFVEEGGERLAKLTYSRTSPDAPVTIQHTFVDPKLRGRGIAGKLVAAAAEWARARDLTIVPECTFARAVFEREPALRDVLAR